MAYLVAQDNSIELIPREGGRICTRQGEALWVLVERRENEKVYLFDPHGGKGFLLCGKEVAKKNILQDLATITTPAGHVYEFHRGIPQAGKPRENHGAEVHTTEGLLAEVAQNNPRLELISYLVSHTAQPQPDYRGILARLCEVTPAARGILALFRPAPEPLLVYNWNWQSFQAKYQDCWPELRAGRIVSAPEAMLLPIGKAKGFLALESTQPLQAEDHYYFHLVASVLSASLENQERLDRFSQKAAASFAGKQMSVVAELVQRAWELYGLTITVAPEVGLVLENHAWQNFQELDATLHHIVRALEESKTSSVLVEHLPQAMQATAVRSLEHMEKEHILRILKQTGGDKSKAAEILGISRKTLYNKLAECGEEAI